MVSQTPSAYNPAPGSVKRQGSLVVPELPEVETVVRDLRPYLIGRRFTRVRAGPRALRRRWVAQWNGKLAEREVRSIRRRGKWIVLELDDAASLVIHLGMTGQLTVVPSNLAVASHTHLFFSLDGGEQHLRFRDVRRFGSALYLPNVGALARFFEQMKLGPEPFELAARFWRERLAETRRCLKAVLLDQRVVAGVGNIYADESLFEARLHPTRCGCELTLKEAERLRRAIVKVLNRAIDYRGSTIRDYVGGSGMKGGYQDEFRVYQQTGQPCRRCQVPIECVRLAGRSTHFCPRCQPMEARG